MTYTEAEARRDLLGLLLAGYTPEEAEAWLAARVTTDLELTALTDPNNLVMQEVTSDGTRPS